MTAKLNFSAPGYITAPSHVKPSASLSLRAHSAIRVVVTITSQLQPLFTRACGTRPTPIILQLSVPPHSDSQTSPSLPRSTSTTHFHRHHRRLCHHLTVSPPRTIVQKFPSLCLTQPPKLLPCSLIFFFPFHYVFTTTQRTQFTYYPTFLLPISHLLFSFYAYAAWITVTLLPTNFLIPTPTFTLALQDSSQTIILIPCSVAALEQTSLQDSRTIILTSR